MEDWKGRFHTRKRDVHHPPVINSDCVMEHIMRVSL